MKTRRADIKAIITDYLVAIGNETGQKKPVRTRGQSDFQKSPQKKEKVKVEAEKHKEKKTRIDSPGSPDSAHSQFSDSVDDKNTFSDVSEEEVDPAEKKQMKKTYIADSALAKIIGEDTVTRSEVGLITQLQLGTTQVL